MSGPISCEGVAAERKILHQIYMGLGHLEELKRWIYLTSRKKEFRRHCSGQLQVVTDKYYVKLFPQAQNLVFDFESNHC